MTSCVYQDGKYWLPCVNTILYVQDKPVEHWGGFTERISYTNYNISGMKEFISKYSDTLPKTSVTPDEIMQGIKYTMEMLRGGGYV